jgi:hypothetical protein
MRITEILGHFIADARRRGMDLRGDAKRWFNPKTARAWTAWLTKARGAA